MEDQTPFKRITRGSIAREKVVDKSGSHAQYDIRSKHKNDPVIVQQVSNQASLKSVSSESSKKRKLTNDIVSSSVSRNEVEDQQVVRFMLKGVPKYSPHMQCYTNTKVMARLAKKLTESQMKVFRETTCFAQLITMKRSIMSQILFSTRMNPIDSFRNTFRKKQRFLLKTLSVVLRIRYIDYPWGKKAFAELLKHLHDTITIEGKYYRIHGFPLAMQVWFYECCSKVDDKIAVKRTDHIPRIINWRTIKDHPRKDYLMRVMFCESNNKIKFRNISATPMEIQILQLPPEYVQSVASPSSGDQPSTVTNSDDDFLDHPTIINNRGKEKVVSASSPVKKKTKRDVDGCGVVVRAKKVPNKAIAKQPINRPFPRNATATAPVNTPPAKKQSKQTQGANHRGARKKLDDTHETPPSSKSSKVSISRDEFEFFKSSVKEEFKGLRELIQDNFKVVLEAINKKNTNDEFPGEEVPTKAQTYTIRQSPLQESLSEFGVQHSSGSCQRNDQNVVCRTQPQPIIPTYTVHKSPIDAPPSELGAHQSGPPSNTNDINPSLNANDPKVCGIESPPKPAADSDGHSPMYAHQPGPPSNTNDLGPSLDANDPKNVLPSIEVHNSGDVGNKEFHCAEESVQHDCAGESELRDQTFGDNVINPVPIQMVVNDVPNPEAVITKSQFELADEFPPCLNPERSIVAIPDVIVDDQTPLPVQRLRRPGPYTTSPYMTSFGSNTGSSSKLPVIFDLKHPFIDLSNMDETSLLDNFWKWLNEGLLSIKYKRKCNEDRYKKRKAFLPQSFNFGVISVQDKNWFYKLANVGQLLNDSHLDVVLYYLRKKKKYSGSTTYNFNTVDCNFSIVMHNIWDAYYDTQSHASKDSSEETILEYINGHRLHATAPWHTVDNIFIPVNVKERFHWVLVVVSFSERCLMVHDSLTGALHHSHVDNEMKKYAQLIPMYLSMSDFYRKKGLDVSSHPKYMMHSDYDSFDIVYVKNIPQQPEGTMDCGVYMLSYAEYLSDGNPIPDSIDSEAMRMRYASLLWNYGMLKIQAEVISDSEAPPKPIRVRSECANTDTIVIP